MLMTRWDPFAEMAALDRRLDRLFADVLGSPVITGHSMSLASTGLRSTSRRRTVDGFKSCEDARVIAKEPRDRLRDEGKY